jgi:hypothetical protein
MNFHRKRGSRYCDWSSLTNETREESRRHDESEEPVKYTMLYLLLSSLHSNWETAPSASLQASIRDGKSNLLCGFLRDNIEGETNFLFYLTFPRARTIERVSQVWQSPFTVPNLRHHSIGATDRALLHILSNSNSPSPHSSLT